MLTIGFSTGALAFSDFGRALELMEGTSANAVELSALRVSELPELLKFLQPSLGRLKERYRYVSFHAPTNFEDERTLVRSLEHVAHLDLNIVVHPDTIKDVRVWRSLGARLCLENLDSRKTIGRTAEELDSFFYDLPQARLCFDIAHARQVDPTMTEAARILSKFGHRLAQAHMSELNGRGKHFRVSFAAKLAYIPFSAILSKIPVILESVVDEAEITAELWEAEEILKSHLDARVAGTEPTQCFG